MNCYYIKLYQDFICLAGACPSTCCSGWSIVVDDHSRKRYEQLEDERLRQDILQQIYQKDGEYRFRNRERGQCAMLDPDGLCRIQKQLEEKALCNTCRKYPRLTARVGEELWISMAASCPVVAGYLWGQKPCWMFQDTEGKTKEIDIYVFPVVREGLFLYQENRTQLQGQRSQAAKDQMLEEFYARENWARFQLFLELTDGILEIMTEFPEQAYLAGSFDYFEQTEKGSLEVLQDITAFEAVWQSRFQHFMDAYLPYRLFTRYLECQREDRVQRYRQVMGELSLNYIILFSRCVIQGELTEEQILQGITWVYRFCVHGAERSRRVHDLFSRLFSESADFVRLLTGKEVFLDLKRDKT